MKRLISWLLALTMIMSLPLSALAVEINDGDPDVDVGFEELLPGYNVNDPIDLTADLRPDFTATVKVPAGKTMYFIANNIGGMLMTINDGEAVECTAAPRQPYAWSITNDGEAEAEYTIKVAFPVGHQMNPKVIEEMAWYSDEVTQAAGDIDGFFYTYTAKEAGTVTLYFNAVYDEETGEAIDFGTQRNITVTNQNTYAQCNLLDDGVDNYGLELQVPVAAGDQLIINTAWVQDAEGNYYPEATYSWSGNFAYPAGSEQNPIAIEWAWNDTYSTATASVEVPEGGAYYTGNAGMILTAGDNAIEMDAEGKFFLAAGNYELVMSTPVGAQANPEVIENIDGYTDSNSLEADGSYYYIWTATEDGTVTLDITDGANIVVDHITGVSEDGWPISVQSQLAEPEIDENWNYTGWTVAENLVIEVKAGEQLKIQVNGLTDWATWTTPAIDYTLTGSFEAAEQGPVVDATLKFAQIGISFKDYIGMQGVVAKPVHSKYDSVYVVALQKAPEGDITETIAHKLTGTAFMFDKQILAWSMAEEVTLTLYAEKDGTLYQGESKTYSVETLAIEKLAGYESAGNSKACKILVDMLNYGAAVQTRHSHNADILPNTNLGAYSKYATTEIPSFEAVNSDDGSGSGAVKVVTNSVSMQSKVEIQFVFSGDLTGYELRSTVAGVTTVIDSSEFRAAGKNFIAKVPVMAANMRAEHTIALYDKATGEAVTSIYTVSIEAYAQAHLNNANRDLVIALLRYGDAVSAL